MEILGHFADGLAIAATPSNLLFCLIGALLGTLIGVLPGIGPLATMALLLPITYYLPPLAALIMLSGIYYGAQYGGSTTAILVNLPGETSSMVTMIDGHAMARRGRAGAALSIAAIGSFFAGCVGTLMIALFAPVLTTLALRFSAPEYFSLMVLGLVAAVVLAQGSLLKALAMMLLGLALGLIGMDVNSATPRFTFGVSELYDGIGFVPVAMGLFGIAEVIANLERPERRDVMTRTIGSLLPSMQEFRDSIGPIIRGTGLGAILGLLPGGGAMLASIGSYALEKQVAKDPSTFGRGAIQGVAGPESANNAAAQLSFVPLLTLGIPGNPVIAMMLAAMVIHGIQPGPQVMTQRPDLFWGFIASMWFGNLMLLIINLPLVGIWVQLLKIPYRLLFPAILFFCCVGAFSLNNSVFEVALAVGFGALGYIFIKLNCEPAPLLLGFVLGPAMEENLRRALLISRGDWTVLITRPLSLSFLLLAVVMMAAIAIPTISRRRSEAFDQGDSL
ncbi:tripartite tricarboxylate transporter permease [Microvirga antarctica]|uniref:tripartite tricarboxylate transporter permease n=1 Tax=Microvirga antarctica TaxID=2819233 RepID=UPI001B30954E